MYKEGLDSYCEHNGTLLLVDDLISKTGLICRIPIKYLTWNLLDNLDKQRILNADLSYPGIATVYKDTPNKYWIAILDGNHRLAKAVMLGRKKLLVKLVNI